MENIYAFLILAVLIGGAIAYLIRARRTGQKCVGCPHAKACRASAANRSCKVSIGH